MLAPDRSRCRFVDWGYVPVWGGLIVAVEEKQLSLTRCVVVMALGAWGRGGAGDAEALGTRKRWGRGGGGDVEAVGTWRRWGLWGLCGVRSAPTGHRIPARGETPGMAHNRCVLKERRIPPGALTCFAVAESQSWRWG
jgi:hypothetical protein